MRTYPVLSRQKCNFVLKLLFPPQRSLSILQAVKGQGRIRLASLQGGGGMEGMGRDQALPRSALVTSTFTMGRERCRPRAQAKRCHQVQPTRGFLLSVPRHLEQHMLLGSSS